MLGDIIRYGYVSVCFCFLCSDRKLHQNELESVKAFHGYQMSNQKSSSALLVKRTWQENLQDIAIHHVKHGKNLDSVLYIHFNINLKGKQICLYCLTILNSAFIFLLPLLYCCIFFNTSALSMATLNFCMMPLKQGSLPFSFEFQNIYMVLKLAD